MKLENLIDALDSMINVGMGTKLVIVNCYDDTIVWQGFVAEFDRKSWLCRSIDLWGYVDKANAVKVYVEWKEKYTLNG